MMVSKRSWREHLAGRFSHDGASITSARGLRLNAGELVPVRVAGTHHCGSWGLDRADENLTRWLPEMSGGPRSSLHFPTLRSGHSARLYCGASRRACPGRVVFTQTARRPLDSRSISGRARIHKTARPRPCW